MYREIYHRPFNLLAFYDLRVPSVSTASVQDTPDSTSSLYLTQMLRINLPFQPFSYQIKKDKHKFYLLKCFLSISRCSNPISHYIRNQRQRQIKERTSPFFQPHLSTLSPSCVCLTELVGQIKTCKDYFCFVFFLFSLFIHLFLTYQDF